MAYTYAEKISILEYARDNGVIAAARHFDMQSSNIIRWNKKYKIYQTQEMRTFTDDQKIEILQYAQKHGLTNAMRQYNVDIATMMVWNRTRKIYTKTGRKKNAEYKQMTPETTIEFKIMVLTYVKDHGASDASRKFNIPHSTLRLWNEQLHIYKPRTLRKFTDAQKAEIVQYADMYGVTRAEKEFNVRSNQIYDWAKQIQK